MTLTTWLLVFGSLTATAIVLDGVRRMFANHAALSIDIDETLCGLPEEDFSSELPNGGARTISLQETLESQTRVDEQLETETLIDELALDVQPDLVESIEEQVVLLDETPEVSSDTLDPSKVIENPHTDASVCLVEQDNISIEDNDLDEPMFALDASPVNLDEEVAFVAEVDDSGLDTSLASGHITPAMDFDPTRPVHEWVETNIMVQSDLFASQDLASLAAVKDQAPHSLVETSDDILFSDTGIEDLALNDENVAAPHQDESLSTRIAKVTSLSFGKNLLNRKRIAAKEASDLVLKREQAKQTQVVEQVISVFVTANHSQGFYGPQLLELLEACGMVHGEMNIFHRFEDGLRLGKTQFSMANMMEPGTFDLAQMDQLHTPGVVFFLTLPTAQNNMQAFDYMLETAQCLASNLGGDVLDEQRSVMRPQTIEHCRQQIREFERRHMTRRAQL
ncbi:MAG: cell division protein ZipA [Oceanospirillaceae bacterium]|nr:cell division protein ZipA [Oceanospirillaceae bacterium]